MGLPENPKKVGNPWVTGWNAYMEPRILIKVSLLKRDMITWQYKDQQGGAQISTGWAVKAWPFLDNETEARLQNLTWSQRKQRHCVYRLVLLAACDFEMQNVLFWLSSFQTVRKQMSGWHCAQGGQWVTQGVGGLCLPWGFHAVQTSTSGMSHHQTHWLLLNWPAGSPLAHREASCLTKHCLYNLLSPNSCPQLSTHYLANPWVRHGDSVQPLPSPCGSKNSLRLMVQRGPVRTR